MSRYRILHESLEDSATVLDTTAAELTAAVGALETTLADLQAPWGTGPVGSVVGELYTDIHNMALSCYEENVEVVDEYAQALLDTVELLKEAERKNSEDIEELAAAIADRFAGMRQQ